MMIHIININWKYILSGSIIRLLKKSLIKFLLDTGLIMNTYPLTHPGLERLARSYEWFSVRFSSLRLAVEGWSGWQRAAEIFHRWGEARIHALAMQDPRMRAEILAAASRQDRTLEV